MGLKKTLETISESLHYNRWVYNNIQDYLNGNILDVGSGLGDIAQYFISAHDVQHIILSDKSGETISGLDRKFQYKSNYSIMILDISDIETIKHVFPFPIDIVTCINVLEHIENDQKALENIYEILKPNGLLILIVPAVPYIYGTLDELVGHYRRYKKKGLNNKINQANFTVEKQYFMNFFGIATWFLAGKVFKHGEFKAKYCRILDKMVPLLEKVERICNLPIGQSIVTICGKYNSSHEYDDNRNSIFIR